MTRKTNMKKLLPAIIIALLTIVAAMFYVDHANNVELQKKQEAEQQLTEIRQQLEEVNTQMNSTEERLKRVETEVSRSAARTMHMEITAYDLSVESCGKAPGTYGYGITATGVSLAGQTLESARAIAVDPNVIPLGSRVRIKFDNPNLKHLNGIYRAVDTGGGIKGNRIDLFMGEGSYDACIAFGRQTARVEIL